MEPRDSLTAPSPERFPCHAFRGSTPFPRVSRFEIRKKRLSRLRESGSGVARRESALDALASSGDRRGCPASTLFR
jgi:hypothetical protein